MPLYTRNRRGKIVNEANLGPEPEQLYFDPTQKKDLKEGFTINKEAYAVINEYFDLSNAKTRKTLLSMNEASQNSVLTSLTSKLYDHIVKKTTSIDYGKIPSTRGDITKLENYDQLKEICEVLRGICNEYKEDAGPIDTVILAMTNVESRKDLFMRGYRADCELPCMIYENVTLGIVSGVSYLIAACIEFIKAPSDETYSIQLDKIAYAKSKDHLLYNALEKFNRACEKGDIDRAINHVIDKRVKKFTGATVATIAGATVLIMVALIMVVIPILRELVYFFYYSKVRTADFFEIQSELLQMNAYNVEANESIPTEERKQIYDKQMRIVNKFKNLSNKFQIDSKQADIKASREISDYKKKYDIDEINANDIDNVDDPMSGSSSLF